LGVLFFNFPLGGIFRIKYFWSNRIVLSKKIHLSVNFFFLAFYEDLIKKRVFSFLVLVNAEQLLLFFLLRRKVFAVIRISE
jgi:hypothetical protein